MNNSDLFENCFSLGYCADQEATWTITVHEQYLMDSLEPYFFKLDFNPQTRQLKAFPVEGSSKPSKFFANTEDNRPYVGRYRKKMSALNIEVANFCISLWDTYILEDEKKRPVLVFNLPSNHLLPWPENQAKSLHYSDAAVKQLTMRAQSAKAENYDLKELIRHVPDRVRSLISPKEWMEIFNDK